MYIFNYLNYVSGFFLFSFVLPLINHPGLSKHMHENLPCQKKKIFFSGMYQHKFVDDFAMAREKAATLVNNILAAFYSVRDITASEN